MRRPQGRLPSGPQENRACTTRSTGTTKRGTRLTSEATTGWRHKELERQRHLHRPRTDFAPIAGAFTWEGVRYFFAIRYHFSLSSMIPRNTSNGFAPVTFSPLTKTVGVADTP